MPHSYHSTVLADESDLKNGDAEEDKVLTDTSLKSVCGLPIPIVDTLSFCVTGITLTNDSTCQCHINPEYRYVILGINYPARLMTLDASNSQVLLPVSHFATDTRNTGLPNFSYVDKWFDTGQEFTVASGCASLPNAPLSSESGAHILFKAIRNRNSCLFAKLQDWEHVRRVEIGVECSCNFRNSCASYKLLDESIAHSFIHYFVGATTHAEVQYLIDHLKIYWSGRALELSELYRALISTVVTWVNDPMATALVNIHAKNGQIGINMMLFSTVIISTLVFAAISILHYVFAVVVHEAKFLSSLLPCNKLIQFLWKSLSRHDYYPLAPPMDLSPFLICPCCNNYFPWTSYLKLLLFEHVGSSIYPRKTGVLTDLVHLISPKELGHAIVGTMNKNVLLGENYNPQIFSKSLQRCFLFSIQYLMMMECAMVFCAQKAAGLENSFQEAQVKFDPLHGKYLAFCLMLCGEVGSTVVNAAVTTISCHVDRVVIIKGEHVTNIVLDPNLEDKVLFEDRSIVVNSIEGNFGKVANYVWDPG